MSPTHVKLPGGGGCYDPATLGDVEWRLRYGEPTREDLLLAASAIDAYRYLVHVATRDRRAEVVRTLRAALAERCAKEREP